MKKCACGCGLEVRNEKNKYIHNHHMRGVPGWNKGKKNPEHSERMKGEGNPMYGKKRPELSGDLNPAKRREVREKIKENNPMKKYENRKKISKAKIGKKRPVFSEEWKRKIGNYRRGKKYPEHSNRMKGELNPNWRGGISCEPYCEEWRDEEYKNSIKERDGYKCLNPECEKKSSKICIHHIDYDKKNCCPFNLITVCLPCNSKANGNREWHIYWYNAIIHRRYNKEIFKNGKFS